MWGINWVKLGLATTIRLSKQNFSKPDIKGNFWLHQKWQFHPNGERVPSWHNEPPVNLYSYKYVSFLPGTKPHKMNFALTERSHQKLLWHFKVLTFENVDTLQWIDFLSMKAILSKNFFYTFNFYTSKCLHFAKCQSKATQP